MVPIEIVFETHSTTEDNEMGRATGWLPGRLSALGRQQAAELGRRRGGDRLAAVFSSDLARSVETVEIAFARVCPRAVRLEVAGVRLRAAERRTDGSCAR